MHQRIRLLRLAAAALALTTYRSTCSVCARSSTAAAAHTATHNGRQETHHDKPDIYRKKNSRHAGQLSSKELRAKRSSTANIPWLTSAASLRGGGRAGAALDVPRGGGPARAAPFAGLRRSAKVSHKHDTSRPQQAHKLHAIDSPPPTSGPLAVGGWVLGWFVAHEAVRWWPLCSFWLSH